MATLRRHSCPFCSFTTELAATERWEICPQCNRKLPLSSEELRVPEEILLEENPTKPSAALAAPERQEDNNSLRSSTAQLARISLRRQTQDGEPAIGFLCQEVVTPLREDPAEQTKPASSFALQAPELPALEITDSDAGPYAVPAPQAPAEEYAPPRSKQPFILETAGGIPVNTSAKAISPVGGIRVVVPRGPVEEIQLGEKSGAICISSVAASLPADSTQDCHPLPPSSTAPSPRAGFPTPATQQDEVIVPRRRGWIILAGVSVLLAALISTALIFLLR